MSRAEEMLPSRRFSENKERTDYSHGSTYRENGETFMDDHISGVDWHVPKKRNYDNTSDDAWLAKLD